MTHVSLRCHPFIRENSLNKGRHSGFSAPPGSLQVRRVERGRLAYYREKADAAFWDRHWSAMQSRGAYAEAERGYLGWFERPFATYLPRAGKILEAGCGMGQHVVALRVRGYDAVGIEWAPRTVQAARSIFPTLPVEVGDVTALRVPDAFFAGYVSLGVMEHRREGPEPFLREAFRVLAPDGIAMISVPHFHPLRRAKGLLGAYGGETADLEFYQYAYGVGEFAGHLRAAGFDVLDRWGYDGIKGLKDELPWLRRLLAHERYGPRVRSILARTPQAERWFGHMMLYVCRKPAAAVPVQHHEPDPAPQRAGVVETRAALQLGVFFTRGMSLRSWDEIGMLEREMALYCQLRDRGIGITLITYGGKEDVSYESRFPGIRVLANVSGLPLAEYEASIEHIHGTVLATLDVFKTNQTNGGDAALRAAHRFGKPLIARCGYMWSAFAALESGPDSQAARTARAAEQALFPQAERAVVTTPEMAQDVALRFPETADRVVVIPNYVDTALFAPAGQKQFQRDLLFVGRLVPQKNLPALLDAIVSLPVRLGIVGQGPLEPVLRNHPASLNGKVEWIGGVPSRDLPGYFRGSRVFVLPSLYEGHPKVLLEAMACGCPVIGTRVPGIASVLTHEQNGILCAPTADGLRQAVQQLLNNERLASELGESARRYVLAQCSLDSVVEKELAVLKEITSGDRPGAELAGDKKTSSSLPRKDARQSLSALLDDMPDAEWLHAVGSYVADRASSTTPENGLRMLFRLEDRLYAAEGELAVRYGNGVHTKHRHTGYHDFFVRRVHQGESVLDVGCGAGAVARDVAERSGATVVGIDLNNENIAAARRMHPHPRVQYAVGNALHVEQMGSTDVIILSNVLEHIAGRPGFLRKLLAHACPKRVLIRVPLFERDWRIPLRQELNVEYRLDSTHETEYT
ncbi:MAG: glycosyltransferase, partial [Bacteroidetes bacterium]|nr:glycosyltransferase [Bacteroidota bacterium]